MQIYTYRRQGITDQHSDAALPSSPPSPRYGISVAAPSSSPTSSRGRSGDREDSHLSPAIARLPPPRTPASTRSKFRDTSSEYYTAVWGSPYQLSPSSRSARTAVSEQLSSEDLLESSPGGLSFGLEHLVPSRLGNLDLSRPGSASSKERPALTEEEEQTPRSRTKRWVQLPQRQNTEKAHWWSDESRSVSDEEKGHKRASSSLSVPSTQKKSIKGHKTREDNRTLDQQSFWTTLRGQRRGDMSSLLASRWAATPPEGQQKEAEAEAVGGMSDKTPLGPPAISDGKSDMYASRWAATPPISEPADEGSENRVAEGDSTKLARTSSVEEPRSNTTGAHEESTGDLAQDYAGRASAIASNQEPARLKPPRSKRRVPWHGKTCIISIPNVDFHKLGLPKPMTSEQIQARLKQFEDAGYSTRGFDLADDDLPRVVNGRDGSLYPNEVEAREEATPERPRVSLPDLKKWSDYMNWLTEQKLAALGVSTGLDEPAITPAQDMSRQTSNQYPPLPFSPPVPTLSAGSMNGRPGMVRGHSHTMSVASPLSPGAGPFGHMHRHSTFTGPFGFPQQQQLQPLQLRTGHPLMPGVQPFSPQNQFSPQGHPRVGSPAQVAALRQDFGQIRGPGSPLGQQPFAPQSPNDYSRGLMEDQRRRQHVYSQSIQHNPVPNAFTPQFQPTSNIQQIAALPELPEEDDEEELQERPEPEVDPLRDFEASTYVPPHKRAQINADIAVPTPRGHRHNISEGLEREMLEAEERHEATRRDWTEVTEEKEQATFAANGTQKPNGPQSNGPAEKAAGTSEAPIPSGVRSHKKTASRFNVDAPAFTFNPSASFEPGSTAFTSNAPNVKTNGHSSRPLGHSRQASSGTFNVAAPAFQPANAMPKSDFSFSSQAPSSVRDQQNQPKDRNIVDELSSIFGKVNIPEIVKPAKKSKAIAIVRPEENLQKPAGSESEYEDEEGRSAQSEDRMKRQRFGGDDGDEVPRFAEPTSMPDPVNFAPKVSSPPSAVALDQDEATSAGVEGDADDLRKGVEQATDGAHQVPEQLAEISLPAHSHKPSTSLSALAKSFEPVFQEPDYQIAANEDERLDSFSELEEGEIRENGHESLRSQEESDMSFSAPAVPELQPPYPYSGSERIEMVAQLEPSFDEIDAVMRQLNETEPQLRDVETRVVSPLPQLSNQPQVGMPSMPGWARSDAPSPSPTRRQMQYRPFVGSSFTAHDRTDSGEQAVDGWAQVHRLNKAEDVPASDWSGMLSPPDEEKLHERSHFFDSRIEDVIGNVVERRLLPLEDNLRSIRNMVEKRSRSMDQPVPKRSSSAIESDADDEDDLPDMHRHRPVSSGRDKRVDQIKAAVLEALREQSPGRSRSSHDLADLHSALADMKVSFARAASASLELDDIRVVVEDVLSKQSQAMVPVVGHKRELSELEGRLNETLAGALEEANHRHAVEEREAETKRMLRLAEEELQLLRETEQDETSRLSALQEERHRLLDRIDGAENARQDAEDKVKGLEAENEAMQATLEEYRLSSSKWRHDLDDGKREREELENAVAALEAQAEENQESSASMKRRLEKLHSDMATAAGQLMSEKSSWKAREDDYRASCEVLEVQNAVRKKECEELQAELQAMRAAETLATSQAAMNLQQLRMSHSSLEESVQKLQGELAQQKELSARHERDFHDAKEAGRAEIHRTRMAMQIDVETANHQVNAVRIELESELNRVRHELDDVRMEAEMAKARHERTAEEQESAGREALRKVNHASSVALEEARQKHESTLKELHTHHARALDYAMEDKQRSEMFLTERLALADAKLQHSEERMSYLQERLQVATSAAQAAALSAHTRASSARPTSNSLPEKISPQALRESILVLQEQLQEREARIERLQNQVDKEGPATLKERDSEITWLREMLAVRRDDLTDLIGSLSQPAFDRAAVRDTAIRIQANLQMEQQEKDRTDQPSRFLGGQALASLSSFATPKAMSSTFSKWRNSMESSSLRNAPRASAPARSYTPSRGTASVPPYGYAAGLMTPPASNLRATPTPEKMASLPPPRLQQSRHAASASLTDDSRLELLHRSASVSSEGPTTPLFREQSYDQDADDSSRAELPSFEQEEDDDLDVPDDQAPAFRSLDLEMESSVTAP